MGESWDAIIINFNGSIFLDPCLRALDRQSYRPARVIVVDNASSDDSVQELASWPSAEVIECSENRGYAGGANLGAGSSDAPLMVFLNPDVELDSEFGANLIRLFSKERSLGAAGAKLKFPDSSVIQHAGGQLHWPELTTSHFAEREEDTGQVEAARSADYVTGAALAVRREAFDAVGGFDAAFYPAYWEDVDLCYQLRDAGWDVEYRPELTGTHHEGGGAKRDSNYFLAWSRNRLRFAMKQLSTEQWWREFVPAEVSRLRGEISAIENPDWFVTSGAASIELFARAGYLPLLDNDPVARAEPLLESISSLQEVANLADPAPPPIQPSDGVAKRIRRLLSRVSGRIYAEELYWQQRQFNESVVRALKAQDRLNRELIAQWLFALLLIGQRGHVDALTIYQPEGEQVPSDS